MGLRTPIPDAERLKNKFGCALVSMVDESMTVEVPSVGGRKPRVLSLRVMAEILQPRATEIFTLLREEVERAEGLTEPDSAPQFAVAIGLAKYGARNRPPRPRMSLSVPVGGISRMGDRVKNWLSEIF